MNEKISNSINPHKLSTLELRALWALDQLGSPQKERFSSYEMAQFLVEKNGITTTRQAIEYAVKQDKKTTNKNGQGYNLMQQGKDKLAGSNNGVILVEPGKPYSGKLLAVKDIFQKLNGEIKLCDPYCGIGLLDLIHRGFDKKNSIKIITANIIDKPKGTFFVALKDLQTEGYNLEIRTYDKSILHDRYIFDIENAWISGNSFNNLGEKESFIVILGKDIKQSLEATFNSRWKVAQII